MRYGKRFAKEVAGKLEMHACPKGQSRSDERKVLNLIADAVNRLLDEAESSVGEQPIQQPVPPRTESRKRAERPLMVPFRAGLHGRVKC